jgi:hypothetical protein
MEPSYAAARTLAGRLQDHFARQTQDPPIAREKCGPGPDAAAIEALVDAGFWASLQREEGFHPEISLAYLPPERAVRPLLFGTPLPLRARTLARLAPAVERPGIHLGVWRERGQLVVWGTTRAIPSFCFVLEVIGPGLMVVKHRTHEASAKFQNLAVFEGERVKVLSPQSLDFAEHPEPLVSLVAPETLGSPDDPVDVLLRLAISMRGHQRGGTLVVVPSDTAAWRGSIVQPLAYAVEPRFTELADLVRDGAAGDMSGERGALDRAVDAVAGLTAVDGATLITDRYELLGFGVKIGRPEGRGRVERVLLSEPIEGGEAAVVATTQLGGTRHISAAQLAQDQPEAFALVASQDGRFTVFAWSRRDEIVHAHRIEALLL